uniref:Uncharacterized protein n=1 Tax=Ulva partita TaxID=1605170 RepID=A0A1C9ZWG2_9CHLO|nr:hypothetical protein [Ulva partita]
MGHLKEPVAQILVCTSLFLYRYRRTRNSSKNSELKSRSNRSSLPMLG